MVYKAGKRTGIEHNKFIRFNLSAGTYSIDDFNTKLRAEISQQSQYQEPPQIKYLKLAISELYTSMASNTSLLLLAYPDNYLERNTVIWPALPPGSYKTFLHTSPPPKALSLHCKQISKVKNELDGQPPSLLVYMHVSNCKTTFSPMPLVYLESEKHMPHLDFKLLIKTTTKLYRGHCISNY